jgi:hypothetical protein
VGTPSFDVDLMTTDETTTPGAPDIDLDSSAFEAQAIEGMLFAKDSAEARAIRELIEQADRRRAAAEREA